MVDFNCSYNHDNQTIVCTWKEPPSIIGGIPVSFKVIINNNTEYLELNNTEISFDVNKSGMHIVSVAVIVGHGNNSLEGKFDDVIIGN